MHITQEITALHNKQLEKLMDILQDQMDTAGNVYTPRRTLAKMENVSQTSLYKYLYDLQRFGRIILEKGRIHVVISQPQPQPETNNGEAVA